MKTIQLLLSLLSLVCLSSMLICFALPYLVEFTSFLTNNSMSLRSDVVSKLNKYGFISLLISVGAFVNRLVTSMEDPPIRERSLPRL